MISVLAPGASAVVVHSRGQFVGVAPRPGVAPATIVQALAERDAALGWEKYTGRADALEQYQAIMAFVVRGARTRRRQD